MLKKNRQTLSARQRMVKIMSDYKVGDVLKNGKQTLIIQNVNDYREPNAKYAVVIFDGNGCYINRDYVFIGDEALKAQGWVEESMNSSGLIAIKNNISIIDKTHEPIPIDEIEKAWESISDVAENGYVDMEEVKLWFAKWLGKDEEEL